MRFCPDCGQAIETPEVPVPFPQQQGATVGDGVKLGCGAFIGLPLLLILVPLIVFIVVAALGSGDGGTVLIVLLVFAFGGLLYWVQVKL